MKNYKLDHWIKLVEAVVREMGYYFPHYDIMTFAEAMQLAHDNGYQDGYADGQEDCFNSMRKEIKQ